MNIVADSEWLTLRVTRGGSWFDAPDACRSAYRDSNVPTNVNYHWGFRVVIEAARPAATVTPPGNAEGERAPSAD